MTSDETRHEAAGAGEQPPIEEQLSDEEMRQRLIEELDELTDRLQILEPEYEPPPFSLERLMAYIEEALKKLPRDVQLDVLGRLRAAVDEDWFTAETLKGAWYMINYTVQYNADVVKRRVSGEYDVDEWGLDWELLDVVRPFFSFLYKVYWRVETAGMDRIPVDGRALLVANHSGQLPWDGLMVSTAVMSQHPAQRLVRTLYSEWLPQTPFVSTWLARMGQTLATVDNGTRLLEQDELVAVYPEGDKGAAKLFKDRYQLARFGEGDFVKMALATGAPIIPVSVVGAEETSITLAQSGTLARLAGTPYFPISPTFPWLGLLGLVPLPTKWYIDFGEPVDAGGYGPDAATNLVLVSQLSDRVRHTVQEMVYDRLARRRSVFF